MELDDARRNFDELTKDWAKQSAEVADLRAVVERVRAIHAVYPAAPDYDPYCSECRHEDGWPCPTVRALDGETP